jgi:hypothetical protein
VVGVTISSKVSLKKRLRNDQCIINLKCTYKKHFLFTPVMSLITLIRKPNSPVTWPTSEEKIQHKEHRLCFFCLFVTENTILFCFTC